jgi:hypothetical protein
LTLSFVRPVLKGVRHLLGDQLSVARPVLLGDHPARFHGPRLPEPLLPKLVIL